jgi:hypothetical protein
MSTQGNGHGTTTRETLDPQLLRLVDEHILAMRRVLEERLLRVVDAHIEARFQPLFQKIGCLDDGAGGCPRRRGGAR